jgi:hypothetical protein
MTAGVGALASAVLLFGCASGAMQTDANGGAGGAGSGGGTGGSGGAATGGGSGLRDGSPDAPDFGPPGQLTCGLSGNVTICSAGQICCADFFQNTVACRTSGCQATESSFICDGPEDCNNGEKCCIDFSLPAESYCATNCASSDSEVCHYSGTCPSSASRCCTSNGAPSGICVAQQPQGSTCN